MMFRFSLESLYHLLGSIEVRATQDVQQPLVAKLLFLRILGLVQSVGINEEGAPLDRIDFLTFVRQMWMPMRS